MRTSPTPAAGGSVVATVAIGGAPAVAAVVAARRSGVAGRRWAVGALLLLLVAPACGGGRAMVPLLATAGVPLTASPPRELPLEVVTRGTGIRDPLPVDGARVTYGDLEGALGHAVASAATLWAENHVIRRPEGWQLTVELIQADAQYRRGRLLVSLGVRATLRTRFGRTYIAQTQAHWREGAVVAPDEGAPLFYACMRHIGRDLTGWMGAIEP